MASLDALLQAGSLERIRSRELRTALARFPAVLDDSGDEERRTRDLVNEELRPALRAAGNVVVAEIVGWGYHEATQDLQRRWPASLFEREAELR